MPTFFINGTSLSNSTAVFLDSEQLICAPDGYYSDGTIVREQVGCTLLPQTTCPSCAGTCPVNVSGNYARTERMSFHTSVNLGFDTGAVIIRLTLSGNPQGVIAELNGSYYNELSSPVHGYLTAPPGLVTYIGQASAQCFCALIFVTPCTYSLNKYVWNGTLFSYSGTEVINVGFSQLELKTSPLGTCVMVVPKTSTGIQTLNFYNNKICYNTEFDIEISCAEPLPTFESSVMSNPSFPEFCTLPIDNTFYVAKVNNIPAYPLLAVNDWVFQDENGEFKLADGYYKTNNLTGTNNTIEVVDGVIVAISFAPCD